METINCNFCSSKTHSLYLALDVKNSEGVIEKFNLVRCSICDLIYLNPRPNIFEIQSYYDDYYYDNRLLNGQYGHGGNRLVSSYKKLRRKLLAQSKTRKADIIQRRVKRGKILDVGCGEGDFLHEMKVHGWDCHGIETSDKMVEHARKTYNIEVIEGLFEPARISSNDFDVITFWSSLEHMHDPMACLYKAYKLLRKGGTIFIMVPNIMSLEVRWLRERWPHLDVPRHLYHFSPRTLGNYLVRNGFRNLQKYNFTGLSLSHYKLLLMPPKWDDILLNSTGIRDCTLSAKIINEVLYYLMLPLSGFSNLLGRGHTFIMLAVK